MLVVISLNHLLPPKAQPEEDSDLPPQEEKEVPQASSSGDQSAIQDEVIEQQSFQNPQV